MQKISRKKFTDFGDYVAWSNRPGMVDQHVKMLASSGHPAAKRYPLLRASDSERRAGERLVYSLD